MEENHLNLTQQNCLFLSVNLEQTKDTFVASILTSFLSCVFSLLTCLGNSVILYVIWKTEELHSPSFVLLFFLAISDALVGLICQPSFVAYHIAEIERNFSVYCTFRIIQTISTYMTSGVSFLTLSAISVDRLLALTLHLRYSTIVTVPRVSQTVLLLWVLSTTIIIPRFWMRNWIILPAIMFVVTFLVTIVSTVKIFQIVRRHQRQINQQQESVQVNTVNMFKCRKSAVTALYVYGLFLLFYLPSFATNLVNYITGYTINVKIAFDYAATAVFINSFLNPIVYCWRIKEIRRVVKNILRKN